MQNNITNNNAAGATQPAIGTTHGQYFTFLGFAEYHGEYYLYDGNFDERCRGTRDQVVTYLAGLIEKCLHQPEDLKWEGRNGWWYSGEEAVNALRAEMADPRSDEIID